MTSIHPKYLKAKTAGCWNHFLYDRLWYSNQIQLNEQSKD